MTHTLIRKVYQGIADRRQMFRLFDRHSQRPNRFEDDADALFRGEWFEIDRASHDYMFEILPPLWMRHDRFALREFLTDSITSVFFSLTIDGRLRFFHAYCDLFGLLPSSGWRFRFPVLFAALRTSGVFPLFQFLQQALNLGRRRSSEDRMGAEVLRYPLADMLRSDRLRALSRHTSFPDL